MSIQNDKLMNLQDGQVLYNDLRDRIEDTKLNATLSTPTPIVSFPDGAPYPMGLQIAIDPVQSGSGDPSPSNVRPITGWTGANVTVAGKNLISELEQGNINSKGADTSNANRVRTNWIKVEPNTEYMFSAKIGENTTQVTLLGFKNKDAGEDYTQYIEYSSVPLSFTTSSEVNYLRLVVKTDPAGAITPADVTAQLEEGATATEYSTLANEYPITFPTSAGTVYGGNLTVNPDGTGELVVEKGCDELTEVSQLSSFTYSAEYGSYAYMMLGHNILPNANQVHIISSKCFPVSYNDRAVDKDRVYARTNGVQIVVRASSSTDITTIEDLFARFEDAVFVYDLATPITYSLTPGQVLSLLGQNNVLADTGKIQSLSYVRNTVPEMIRQDTAGQIAAVVNPVESSLAIVVNGNTASKNITSGQYVYIKNHSTLATGMYHATAAIAAGASITSSNVSADNEGGLNTLNSKLTQLGVYNTLTAVAGTNVTIIDLIWTAIGKLNIIQFNFTVTSQISSGQQLIKSIPVNAPYTNCVGGVFTMNVSNVFKTAFLDNYGGNDGVCLVSTGDFPSGSYRGSIVYIAS